METILALLPAFLHLFSLHTIPLPLASTTIAFMLSFLFLFGKKLFDYFPYNQIRKLENDRNGVQRNSTIENPFRIIRKTSSHSDLTESHGSYFKRRFMAADAVELLKKPMALPFGNYASSERGVPEEAYEISKLFDQLYYICYRENFQFTAEQLEEFLREHHSIFVWNNSKAFSSIHPSSTDTVAHTSDSFVSNERLVWKEIGKELKIKCKHTNSHSTASRCVVIEIFTTLNVLCGNFDFPNSEPLQNAAPVYHSLKKYTSQQLGIEKEPIQIDASLCLQKVYQIFFAAISIIQEQLDRNNSSLVIPIILIQFNLHYLSKTSANLLEHLKFLPSSLFFAYLFMIYLRRRPIPLQEMLTTVAIYFGLTYFLLKFSNSNHFHFLDAAFCTFVITAVLITAEVLFLKCKRVFSFSEVGVLSQLIVSSIVLVFSFGYPLYTFDTGKVFLFLNPTSQIIIKLNMYLVVILAFFYATTVVLEFSNQAKIYFFFITLLLGMFCFLFDRIYDSDNSNVLILNWLIVIVFGKNKTLLLLLLWIVITFIWVINLFCRCSKGGLIGSHKKKSVNSMCNQLNSTCQGTNSAIFSRIGTTHPKLEQAHANISKNRHKNLTRRKEFHFLISINVILAIIFNEIELLCLALVGVLWLFLLLEILRYSEISFTISEALNNFAYRFIDSRDQQGIIHTHIFLLLGVGIPIIYEFISAKTDSFDFMQALIGVFVVGIGDAMSAIVGSTWGKKKMPRCCHKSVAGSAAFCFSIFGALSFTNQFLSLHWSNLAVTILAISSTLFEAYTQDLDNLHLSLYASAVLRALKCW